MKYSDINEARKNPDMSARHTSDSWIEEQYEIDETQFISFTTVHKLGINPVNEYNTAYGIYAYPLEYVFNETVEGMPFAHDRKYIWSFNISGLGITVSTYQVVNLNKDIEKLKSFCEKSGLWYPDSFDVNNYISTPVLGLFEYTLRISDKRSQNVSEKIPMFVTYLMVHVLGYNYCNDDGFGAIHENEPTQCVVYNPLCIQNKQCFRNTLSTDNVRFSINLTKITKSSISVNENKSVYIDKVAYFLFAYQATKRNSSNLYAVRISSNDKAFSVDFGISSNKEFNGNCMVNGKSFLVDRNKPLLDIFIEIQNKEKNVGISANYHGIWQKRVILMFFPGSN